MVSGLQAVSQSRRQLEAMRPPVENWQRGVRLAPVRFRTRRDRMPLFRGALAVVSYLLADKSITTPPDGFYKPWCFRRVFQLVSQAANQGVDGSGK